MDIVIDRRPARMGGLKRLTTAAAVALALVAAAPAGAATRDDAIGNLDQYNSTKARTLASNHHAQLVSLYDGIYHCLPWVDIHKGGIGFRKPKWATEDDRYLATWIVIDQKDDGRFGTFTRERRASAMFSRYGVDLLRRMTAMTSVATDANLTGFAVVLSWPKPGVPMTQPVTETLALFVDKASLGDFLAKRLASTDFANRARISMFDGKDPVGPIKLEIWDDTFNSTYKLKNYEAPKEAKCSG